ncbi:hypothetical protein BCR34DRAFT_585498 [Clohesyomyces aquaticus]|uniref:Uncharacterized protein n=1 Tax=Clohesyomyces aquaticus TaxID=1231657 RepID=A0A1Y1ZXP9_9PLEO|nr:hypothetical protein BCR34DRAFT_585498 [Clohesyomyces aquaticus]
MARTKQTKRRGKKVRNGEQSKLQDESAKAGAIGTNGQSDAAGEQQVEQPDGTKSHRKAKQEVGAEARRKLEKRKQRKAELINRPKHIQKRDWVVPENVECRVKELKQAIEADDTAFKVPAHASPGVWRAKATIWSHNKEKWAVRNAEPGDGMQGVEVGGTEATARVKQKSDRAQKEKATVNEKTARVNQPWNTSYFLTPKEKNILRRIRLRSTRNPKAAIAIEMGSRPKPGGKLTAETTEPNAASEGSGTAESTVAFEPANASEDQEMEWEGCGD